jgi:hypothetical protein
MGCARSVSSLLRVTVALFSAAALVVLSVPPVWAGKWPPFADDLKVSRPQIDPEADAEALLWQIKVLDELNPPSMHSDISHYLRVKIFTDRGKETAGRVDILHENRTTIVDLAARTIRPDGSVVEVPRSNFYERTIVKASGRKSKAVSFAFPSVDKGCIVEYRWTERRYEQLAHGVQLRLQRDVPVRTTELMVRPLSVERFQFQMRSFNMPTPHFEDAPDGFRKTILPPVPAWREETAMPPEFVVVPQVVFSYQDLDGPPPERFWSEYCRAQAGYLEERIRFEDSVQQKAAALASGAASREETLDRLHEFCRSKIRNVDEDALGAAVPADSKSSRSPAETLKRGAGDASDIDYLFAAMARSLGYETRIARTADRRDYLFDPRFQMAGILEEFCVAVRSGESWRYFDPAARYVPAGMIPWWEEGQQAILIDPKQDRFETLPISPPDSNRIEGRANFRLLADGTLEGTASESFTGHWSARLKKNLDDVSPEKQVDDLKAALKAQYPGAEIDSIRYQHTSEVAGDLARAYHIRIPGYAVRAGSRLLVSPAFFQTGAKALFARPERSYPVYFDFAAIRTDEVRIELPATFEVETAPDTKPFAVAGFVRLDSSIQVALDGRSIRLGRMSRICENSAISFPASQYPAIKATFDRMREIDETAVSLRGPVTASGQ